MTFTLNGCGTRLCGTRPLNEKEIKQWEENFPFHPQIRLQDYRLTTESFCLLWVPIIPLHTYVIRYVSDENYQIIYSPFGEGKISWEHVKSSLSFWIAPVLIILFILFSLFAPLLPSDFNSITSDDEYNRCISQKGVDYCSNVLFSSCKNEFVNSDLCEEYKKCLQNSSYSVCDANYFYIIEKESNSTVGYVCNNKHYDTCPLMSEFVCEIDGGKCFTKKQICEEDGGNYCNYDCWESCSIGSTFVCETDGGSCYS